MIRRTAETVRRISTLWLVGMVLLGYGGEAADRNVPRADASGQPSAPSAGGTDMTQSDSVLRVESGDGSFREFYEALALALGENGKVYLQYHPIPPNARYAAPPPQELLVRLNSTGGAALAETARRYLGRGGRTLTIRSGDSKLDWNSAEAVSRESLLEMLRNP